MVSHGQLFYLLQSRAAHLHDPFRPIAVCRLSVAAVLAAACTSSGCAFHVHTVGLGAAGSEEHVLRQYYWVFGLIRFNEVDAQRMAGDLTSYTIETKYGFVDFLLTPFLLPLLATSRTVTVRT